MAINRAASLAEASAVLEVVGPATDFLPAIFSVAASAVPAAVYVPWHTTTGTPIVGVVSAAAGERVACPCRQQSSSWSGAWAWQACLCKQESASLSAQTYIKMAKSGKAKVCLPLEWDIPHGLILYISGGGRLLPLLQILGGGAQLALLRFAGTGVVPVWSQLFLPQGLQLKRRRQY